MRDRRGRNDRSWAPISVRRYIKVATISAWRRATSVVKGRVVKDFPAKNVLGFRSEYRYLRCKSAQERLIIVDQANR